MRYADGRELTFGCGDGMRCPRVTAADTADIEIDNTLGNVQKVVEGYRLAGKRIYITHREYLLSDLSYPTSVYHLTVLDREYADNTAKFSCGFFDLLNIGFPREQAHHIGRTWPEVHLTMLKKYLSAPYRDGGGDPTAFDCWGLCIGSPSLLGLPLLPSLGAVGKDRLRGEHPLTASSRAAEHSSRGRRHCRCCFVARCACMSVWLSRLMAGSRCWTPTLAVHDFAPSASLKLTFQGGLLP